MPPADFSISGIFLQSTGVVEAVLVALLLCSVLSWAIIFEKLAVLLRLRGQSSVFEALARSGAEAFDGQAGEGLSGLIVAEGRAAWADDKPGESHADRRDRIERAMRDAMVGELLRGEARLHWLATVGSSAPFIGLFGTVWGIMHAFAGIAQSNDTSLAVVAPGIAEALSTTALGLAAAIPASIAYNRLAASFSGRARRLALAVSGMVRRLDDPPRQAAE